MSDEAGTTRDVIETYLNLDGFPVILADTAGIREAKNEVEKKGISLALSKFKEADLNIVVVDNSNKIISFLKSNNIKSGDRIAAYLPNIIETVEYFIGTSAIGAIWSSCSPDFGVKGVIERFAVMPRVTTTQRGNLAGIQSGAVIYNMSTSKLQVYAGSAGWQDLN